MTRRAAVATLVLAAAAGCTPVVRYTNELTDGRHGRTWFTRLPSTFGATAGFAVGLPVDLVSLPLTVVVYESQDEVTRDALSVFLFPSFVLWKVGALIGAPFDAVEWGLWRSWRKPAPVTDAEREAIEREWDKSEYNEYPVTPLYPLPTPR
ncbi:MAG: hypothetical protein H6835_16135 [Planctomycetes bacterium]|nr:hypothetical protein [Planctomycetota bacterium]